MAQENPTQESILKLKKLIRSYFSLFKIKFIKKSTQIVADLSIIGLGILLGCIGFLFLGFALAFAIGEAMSSFALGFLIVGGGGILLLFILLLFRRPIRQSIQSLFIRIITQHNHEENK